MDAPRDGGRRRQGALRGWLSTAFLVLRQFLAVNVFDAFSYRFDRLPLRHRDLRGFSHVVASREGLFALSRSGHRKIAGGQFYGVTVRGGSLFCFQAHGYLWSRSNKGRIVELRLADGVIAEAIVRAKGLDNGCHQIDFIGDRLYVVDTYNQRIVELAPDFASRRVHQPIAPAPRDAWDEGYAHVNSIVWHAGEIYLLKSNGGSKTGRASEVIRCREDLTPVEEFRLPGLMCHNLLFLEDGRMLSCGSAEGAVIDRRGEVLRVGGMMTRGLSVDGEVMVVGDSYFAIRHQRRYAPGNVFFYDRGHRLLARQELPAAPTEIRKIDGDDLSLSNRRRAAHAGAGQGTEVSTVEVG